MQDLAIRTYVALENMQFRVRETLADEDGQTAAEYVGILAFVAAVLTIVIGAGSGIGSAIVGRITSIISSL
jgi:Flp pilus assembly pilin Flp